MNNPSPLIPQGTLLDQKNRTRARMRTAFLFIAGVHVIGLVTLLTLQGCKHEQAPAEPAVDTNAVPAFDPGTNAPMDTNTYLPPALETNVAPPIAQQAPASAMNEYTIVKGDSFYTVAKKFNVTMKALQEANPGKEPTRLKIGDKLMIPAATAGSSLSAAPTAAPADTGATLYSVKSGDTLTSIAKGHGVSVKSLRSENNLTTDRIKVGQKLRIPAKTAAAPAAASEPAPAPAPAPAPGPMH